MKTSTCLIILVLLGVSCKSPVSMDTHISELEIYKTVPQWKLPQDLFEELTNLNIQIESDSLSSIVGYVHKDVSISLAEKFAASNSKLLITNFTIDPDNLYLAIVAVKNSAVLNNTNIKKTKANKKNIEIYFNSIGTKTWARTTKNNIGNSIAFAINNKIYCLTSVNGEIRNGVAVINGLESDDVATTLSHSINSGL